MFVRFREFFEAVQRGTNALERIAESPPVPEATDTLVERLDGLERKMGIWEADTEALLLKAGGKLQAANNAESRARTMKRNYEDFFEDSLENRAAEIEAEPLQLGTGDDPAGTANGLLPLSLGLETDERAARLRAKFGL